MYRDIVRRRAQVARYGITLGLLLAANLTAGIWNGNIRPINLITAGILIGATTTMIYKFIDCNRRLGALKDQEIRRIQNGGPA